MNTARDQHHYNASCGCSACDRTYNTAQRMISAIFSPVWDSCEIRFTVRSPEAVDVGSCDELPAGWVVKECPRFRLGWSLVFEVQGVPSERDGAIVRRILQRMGVL